MIRGLPSRPSAEQEKGRQISGVTGTAFGDFCGGPSQICNHLALYLYAAGQSFHSLGIRANARVGFPRAKTAPGGQTKPNGCIVFLVLVSCSGQRRCGAGVWGFRRVSTVRAKSFIVRHMMYVSAVSQSVSFFSSFSLFFLLLKEQVTFSARVELG